MASDILYDFNTMMVYLVGGGLLAKFIFKKIKKKNLKENEKTNQ